MALSLSPIHRSPIFPYFFYLTPFFASPSPSLPPTAEPGPRLDKTSLHQGLEKLSKNRINGYSI